MVCFLCFYLSIPYPYDINPLSCLSKFLQLVVLNPESFAILDEGIGILSTSSNMEPYFKCPCSLLSVGNIILDIQAINIMTGTAPFAVPCE